jgi:hypothetical protein
MFRNLENNRPFLKMAFEGFAGDGKTFTAAKVAIGLHKLIKSTKPIALFDTEKAFKALTKLFQDNGIQAVVSDEQRSLAALNQAIQWCEQGNAEILIVDSITHVWEEFLRAYQADRRTTRLEFQDWAVVKPRWKNEFSTPFVNAKVHIIFTGRAGFEYTDEKDERGKRQIVKSGIKMKAETETAFEPDLLVLMEKKMDLLGERKTISRSATVIKDRTDQIDGLVFVNPDFDSFAPAIRVLLDGVLRQQTEPSIQDTFESTEDKAYQNRRRAEVLTAEIAGTFNLMGLGASNEDKKLKSAILNKIFGVVSMEAVEQKIRLKEMEFGYSVLKNFAASYAGYLANCADLEVKPDMKQVAEILQSEINAAKEAATLPLDNTEPATVEQNGSDLPPLPF